MRSVPTTEVIEFEIDIATLFIIPNNAGADRLVCLKKNALDVNKGFRALWHQLIFASQSTYSSQ